jgi:hypothetical protein
MGLFNKEQTYHWEQSRRWFAPLKGMNMQSEQCASSATLLPSAVRTLKIEAMNGAALPLARNGAADAGSLPLPLFDAVATSGSISLRAPPANREAPKKSN